MTRNLYDYTKHSTGRTYATYSSSIIISMISNYLIVDVFEVSHLLAWFTTMIWTGIYNYFMLKATWKGKKVEEPMHANVLASNRKSVGEKWVS